MKYPWEIHPKLCRCLSCTSPPKVDKYAGFNANITDYELVEWLRYLAIEDGAPARLVDRLGELECITEDEVERKISEAEEIKYAEAVDECCDSIEYIGERLGLGNEQIKRIVDYIRTECSE